MNHPNGAVECVVCDPALTFRRSRSRRARPSAYAIHTSSEHRKEHGHHFSDHHRVVVRDYYQAEFRGGNCPPGLRKRNNGCLPPGRAKKWHVGHRLPSDIVYYELPTVVIVQLPPPKPGHRYVRVASDILLIAVGTGMVIDAIEDLGRM